MKGKVQNYEKTLHGRKNRYQIHTSRGLLFARPRTTRRKRKADWNLGAEAFALSQRA